jgi:hypothetical protein
MMKEEEVEGQVVRRVKWMAVVAAKVEVRRGAARRRRGVARR